MTRRTTRLLALGSTLLACAPGAGDYPRELEEAICEWRHACHAYARVSDCVDANSLDRDPKWAYYADAVAAGTMEYDADAAAACLDAMAGRGCLWEDPEPEVCARVYRGRVGRNEPCMDSAECAGDAVCGFDPVCKAEDACCPGACRVFSTPVTVEKGEACAFNGASCVEGSYCAAEPGTGLATVCTANVKPGGDCTFGAPCAEGSACDGEVCREIELRGPGESCEGALVACEAPAKCRYFGGTQVCVSPTVIGSPCESSSDCDRVDSFCELAEGEGLGRCALLPGVDQGCANGYQCLPYLDCLGGEPDSSGGTTPALCQLKGGEGDACGTVGEGSYTECLGDLQCVLDGSGVTGVCQFPAFATSAPCPVPTP